MPLVFGKRPDGTMVWPNVLLLLPFLLFTWMIWFFQTRLTRERVFDEVAPSVWLGRRAAPHDIPSTVALIVDLTAEFPEPSASIHNYTYLCLPTLDHEAPERAMFQEAVGSIMGRQGGVYTHCALEHGRSAMVAAAVLVARGQANSVEQAMAHIKAIRPQVRLSASQWARLQEWQAARTGGPVEGRQENGRN